MIDYVSRSDYVQNSVGSVEFDDSTDGSWVGYTYLYGSLRVTKGYDRLVSVSSDRFEVIFAFVYGFLRLVV